MSQLVMINNSLLILIGNRFTLYENIANIFPNIYRRCFREKDYVFILVLIRLILDGIAGFKYLCELKPKHAFALIKAHLAFYRRLPKLLKQRKSNNPSVKYYQKNSIVWLYYIKRKTTFKIG